MEKILLIGGGGYIGSVLTGYLLENGYYVRNLDLLLYDNGPCMISYLNNPFFDFIHGDMGNPVILEKALAKVDHVVLLAGLVGDPITKKYPEESRIINDCSVRTVVDICVRKKIKRLVFISTCSNYGLIKDNELATEGYPLRPLSIYAKSKVNAETYIMSLKDKVDIHPTILRFATAFGISPRMRFDLTVNDFTHSMYFGEQFDVYDVNTWRPYCHVKDFSRLIKTVLETAEEKVSFEIFNAGSDSNNYTKQMIIDEIANILNCGSINYLENGVDPRNYRVDFSKVKLQLGFNSTMTVADGMQELIDTFNKRIFTKSCKKNNLYGNYQIDYTKTF